MGRKRIYLNKGDKFNYLSFIEEIYSNISEKRMGLFECNCGDINYYPINNVRNNNIKRCKKCKLNIQCEASRKYKVIDIFEKFNTEEESYILGIFFADGTIRGNDNTLSISLVEDDVQILNDIKNIIQPTKPLHYCNILTGRNQYRLSISHKNIREKFIKMGCIRNKSLILKYPDKPVSDKDFIRGYIDGDGHISNKNLSIMGTEEFLRSIHKIFSNVLKNDLKIRMYRKKDTTSNTWQMSISYKKDRIVLLDWLYSNSNLKLDRKYNSYLKHNSLI